jgi:hypothetical protein
LQRFERSLVAAGERVLRVAPKLMGASRRGAREPESLTRSTRGRLSARYCVRESSGYPWPDRPRDPCLSCTQGSRGQERIEAMRCLKRHLARHYHRILCASSPDTSPTGSYLPSALITATGTPLQKRFSSLKAPRTAVILRYAPVVLRHLAGGCEEGTCQLPDRLRNWR